MTSSQVSSTDDDVRRSIDVLDQVLSEFDDIEPFYGDDHSNPVDLGGSSTPQGDQEVPDEPPPIDRSLKPKTNPPTLPQKIRKKSVNGGPESVTPSLPLESGPPSFSNTHRSLESRRSEVSSHDYQEINSDLCSSPYRRKSACTEREKDPLINPQRHRRRSNKEYSPRMSGGGHIPRMVPPKGLEPPLRKSRSGDVSLTAEDVQLGRGRKSSRRHPHQRRGRSSDRYLDHHHQQQLFFDPRRLSEGGPVDPRVIDSNFVDQRGVDPHLYDPRLVDHLYDPRLVDPRQFDPRFMSQKVANQRLDPRFLDNKLVDPNLCDPRLLDPSFLDPPIFLEDPLLMSFEGPRGRHPVDNSVQFPHLMATPVGVGSPGSYSLPPTPAMNFHPHTIPPYEYLPMQDPLMGPDPILPDYPFHAIDPHFEGMSPQVNGFDPCLQTLDPSLPPMRSPLGYPMDGPMAQPPPFSCPPDFLPANFSPRERLSLDGGGGRDFPYSRDPRLVGERGWLPPTPEEARKAIQRVVRNQNHTNCEEETRDGRDRFANGPRTAKYRGGSGDHFRHPKSTGSSDSSGRSSSLEDIRCRQGDNTSRSSKGYLPPSESRRNSGSNAGVFRVGEAVRRDEQPEGEFDEKETVSVPRYVSGGKDSGFDESPIIDEASSVKSPTSGGATPHGTVGGGFVVAGVFSDSSKMYIPAPPSPIPDYDHDHDHDHDHDQGLSDGDDLDILPEPFYVSAKVKITSTELTQKSSTSSNRHSLSEDSLQGGTPIERRQESPPSKEGNSLQAMMAEFHMGLPPPPTGREEGRFSDDSLEEEESSSILSPSRPSTNDDLQSQRPESMESLISMDGSTTSFDYMSDLHQHKNVSALDKAKRNSSEGLAVKGNDKKCRTSDNLDTKYKKFVQKSSPKIKKKDVQSCSKDNDAVKGGKNNRGSLSPSVPSTNKDILSESSPRDASRGSGDSDGVPRFSTIKHLIKEGLIKGLDETPPDFAPPPPPKMIRSSSLIEERADSGIGSTASTNNRADESVNSDSPSDRLSSTPPEKTFENCASREILQRRTSSPPPLPPPRDSSMSARPSVGSDISNVQPPPLVRNQSWLYKNKKLDRPPNHKSNFGQKSSVEEKLAHCENANRNLKERRTVTSGPNNNLASQYATPQDHQESELDNHTFHENMKNLHTKTKVSESYSLISDDQASVSSHGSRSGRFFSRFTESMKSGSRTNSPLAAKHGKDPKSKKAASKYHADFIRVPSRIKSEAPQPPLGCKPPEFKNISDPSSIVPLSRDGSGRFRSIEDLAEVSGKSLELRRAEDDHKKKGKKNSTLPPNLTPADMLEQEKDSKRTPSENKNKDEPDGSKFKFNIFKGLWRRNKYSFDKV